MYLEHRLPQRTPLPSRLRPALPEGSLRDGLAKHAMRGPRVPGPRNVEVVGGELDF